MSTNPYSVGTSGFEAECHRQCEQAIIIAYILPPIPFEFTLLCYVQSSSAFVMAAHSSQSLNIKPQTEDNTVPFYIS